MYTVLPSQIELGFGYILGYRPEQGPAPNQGKPGPTQTGQGSSQVGPARWNAPRDLAILLGVGLPPLLDPIGSNKGAGYMVRVLGALGGTLEQVESF